MIKKSNPIFRWGGTVEKLFLNFFGTYFKSCGTMYGCFLAHFDQLASYTEWPVEGLWSGKYSMPKNWYKLVSTPRDSLLSLSTPLIFSQWVYFWLIILFFEKIRIEFWVRISGGAAYVFRCSDPDDQEYPDGCYVKGLVVTCYCTGDKCELPEFDTSEFESTNSANNIGTQGTIGFAVFWVFSTKFAPI